MSILVNIFAHKYHNVMFVQGLVECAASQQFYSSIQPISVRNWICDSKLLNVKSSDQLNFNYKVFGHPNNTNSLHDTIGFFIAKYKKL